MGKLEKSILEENKRIAEIQEDAKIDKLIRRGFLMEAEEVEREFIRDDADEDEEIYSEMFDNIMKTVKENKRKKEEEETEKKKVQELSVFGEAKPKKKPVKNKFLSFFGRRRVSRWVAVFCVTIIGALAFTVTSEADKAYKLKQIERYKGKEFNLQITNHDKVIDGMISEEDAVEQIQKDLAVEMPKLKYKCEGMELISYYSSTDKTDGSLQYDYDGTIITLSVMKLDKNSVASIGVQGKVIDKIKTQAKNIDVDIVVTHNEGEEYNTYFAYWTYKNIHYSLCAYMDGEEFMKIVENLEYES